MTQKLGFTPVKLKDFSYIYWPLDSYSANGIFQNGFKVRHSSLAENSVGMPGEKVTAFSTYDSAFDYLRSGEDDLQFEFLQDPEVKYEIAIQKLGNTNPVNTVYKKYQQRISAERNLVKRVLEGAKELMEFKETRFHFNAKSLLKEGIKEPPKLPQNRFHFTARSLVRDGYGVDIPEFYIFELDVPELKKQGNDVLPQQNNYPAVIVHGHGFDLRRSVSYDCGREFGWDHNKYSRS